MMRHAKNAADSQTERSPARPNGRGDLELLYALWLARLASFGPADAVGAPLVITETSPELISPGRETPPIDPRRAVHTVANGLPHFADLFQVKMTRLLSARAEGRCKPTFAFVDL
jgi:hypothetical protein